MALFSELDWLIIAGVGAFLFLGPENRAVMRELGRWYGRAVRVKRELLSDIGRAADIPALPAGQPASLREVLLTGLETSTHQVSGIPAAVTRPPAPWVPPAPAAATSSGSAAAGQLSHPNEVPPGWAS